MATYWTLAQLTTKIQNDCDLESETFIQPSELTALINEAIDEAEKYVHKLGLEDDYFLTFSNISLVSGTNTYDLPSNIYAHKIRGLVFNHNNLVYPLQRFRGREIFEQLANAQEYSNSVDYYRYLLVNDATDVNTDPSPQILLAPTPGANQTNAITIWYIRSANTLSATTDKMDIPEAAHFIMKYVKFMVYFKEGHHNTQMAKAELDQERVSLVDTLSAMVPDQNSEIVPDLSAYNEMT